MASIALSLLKSKGESVLSISTKLGVSRGTVYDALNCRLCSSRRVRLEISSFIGRPPSLLFPDLPAKTKILDDFEFMSFKSSK